MRIRGRLREPMANQVNQPARRSRGAWGTFFARYRGRRAEDVHALRAWHPAARISVVMTLGILGGINIWMDAATKRDSLPKLHVTVSPAKLGHVAPTVLKG